MMVTAMILTVVFGLIAAILLRNFLFASVNALEVVLFIISLVVFSIGAGLTSAGSWSAFIGN